MQQIDLPQFMEQGHGYYPGDFLLNIKFFDVPETVAAAIRNAPGYAGYCVHTFSGRKTIRAARHATDQILLGVIELPGLSRNPERLAILCYEEGLDGVLCNEETLPLLKELPEHFQKVTYRSLEN